MIFGILLFLFILVCLILCLLILVQSDKGGGISGAIGGLSGANNFLGTQDTANILTKGTYIIGSAFLVLCILMTFTAPGGAAGPKSAMQKRAERVQGVTPMPVSSGMDFVDEAAGGGEPAIQLIEGGEEARTVGPGEAVDIGAGQP